ncbi:hypothetical protein E5720_05295 [Rhodococcus sp. PAMC28707]|uniref:hypothetical protein n=1 Tax=unclassified Rhodococcus (in: high G+C Gram-positive bacteria) TaxID=192944 RepID=UPI00109DC814|nr:MULTISPECIES: hypothetical protein [unclassified Rhodococcus (in: high G+C Gram-positive bacteria)]QCB50304.1 hypothetical protein E5769_08720 [Rhodococcus sp. PAMC28705]QCB58004.1 hypothetical protein E5720_05295 [Rhodococcus sp. PAMC28707]
MRFLAAGVLLCILLVGCASEATTAGRVDVDTTSSPAATDPLRSPSSPPVPVEVPVGEVGTMFESTPELIRAAPTPFESWSQISPNTIAIHFVTGTPECYGADAKVTETDTEVVIALRTGTRQEAADKACIMVAVYGTMQMTLHSPLGDRTVVNAA